MVIIGDLPEIVDYEASGYDRSSGSLYQIEVYLMEIYSDDNPDMHVDFTCRFLYGGQPSPIADQTEINQMFRLNKISLAEFPEVIQWLTDAEDVPCEAGGLAVRLVTRDLILDCPRARSVVAILTVNFVGWDYLHSDHVDEDLAERVAAAVAEVMGVGRPIARAAVDAVLAGGRTTERDLVAAAVAEAMDRTRPADKAAVDALERFVIRDLEGGTTSYCVVCMEELSAGCETTRMPCSHLFHGECITTWLLNRSDCCPLCRSQLPSDLS